MQSDALALEYQRYYGAASRDVNVADLVNNPTANGVCSVLRLGLAEEFLDNRLLQLGALFQNGSNAPVVTGDVVDHFSDVLLFQSNGLVCHVEANTVEHKR